MASSLRISFLLDAITTALRAVASVPASQRTDHFVREADSLRIAVESWQHSPPTPEVRDGVMRRVLGLHTTAAKLRREAEPQ